jgi:hypothetical protein
MIRVAPLLSALVLSGVCLHAADPIEPQAQTAPKPAVKLAEPEGLRFGLQLGFAFPTTDTFKYYSDKSMGMVFGAQMTWDLKADRRLRGRVDFTKFPKKSVGSLAINGKKEDATITGVTGMIDYIWFTDGKPEGFYVTGGLGIAQWNQDTSTTGNTKDSSLAFAGGLGWQFNKTFGLELRSTWSRWETNIKPSTIHNAGTLNLEGSFRF